MPRLFCFGMGYSAQYLSASLLADGWSITGTSQTVDKCVAISKYGVDVHLFNTEQSLEDISQLARVTHILSSVPPDKDDDPVLRHHGREIVKMPNLQWVGYLSATSVYGDTGGAWVDETADCCPTSERARQRMAAEARWLRLKKVPVHIFRLAGIYGPRRSAFDRLRLGQAKRIDQPDRLFSRIHVDDIVTILRASIAQPNPGSIYNLCDDKPASNADVIAYAAELLGVDPPPLLAMADANLSPLAQSFYRDNRLVTNRRIKEELNIALQYPDYLTGLRAILEQEVQT